jgi:hypothetical protein
VPLDWVDYKRPQRLPGQSKPPGQMIDVVPSCSSTSTPEESAVLILSLHSERINTFHMYAKIVAYRWTQYAFHHAAER